MKTFDTFPSSSDADETAPVVMLPASSPTLSEGLWREAAGAELFAMPESKSPKLRWMERHYITVRLNAKSTPATSYEVYHGMDRIATGPTEDDAIVSAAKSLNTQLWNGA